MRCLWREVVQEQKRFKERRFLPLTPHAKFGAPRMPARAVPAVQPAGRALVRPLWRLHAEADRQTGLLASSPLTGSETPDPLH